MWRKLIKSQKLSTSLSTIKFYQSLQHSFVLRNNLLMGSMKKLRTKGSKRFRFKIHRQDKWLKCSIRNVLGAYQIKGMLFMVPIKCYVIAVLSHLIEWCYVNLVILVLKRKVVVEVDQPLPLLPKNKVLVEFLHFSPAKKKKKCNKKPKRQV